LEGGDVVVVRGRYCCLGVTLKKAVGLVLFVGQSLDGGGLVMWWWLEVDIVALVLR
jgi:hypothetical protein